MPAIKLSHVKFVAKVVASFGVAKVVGDIVESNTTVESTTDKVLVQTGSLVLGSMLVDQASSFVEKEIDDFQKNVKEQRAAIAAKKTVK